MRVQLYVRVTSNRNERNGQNVFSFASVSLPAYSLFKMEPTRKEENKDKKKNSEKDEGKKDLFSSSSSAIPPNPSNPSSCTAGLVPSKFPIRNACTTTRVSGDQSSHATAIE